MKQTVYFSKTERLPDGIWECTIAHKGIERDDNGKAIFMPEKGDAVYDIEVSSYILSTPKEQGGNIIVLVDVNSGTPCVGREYTIGRR